MDHILIVDDDRAFVVAISESLRFRGYKVSSAGDAVEALAQVEQNPPDLVLMDIEMPGMDGMRLCRELRSKPNSAALPVIFMSVRSELKDKLAAYEAGADDYLIKPFNLLELTARLQAVLRRSAREMATDRGRQAHLEVQPTNTKTERTTETPEPDHVMVAKGLRLYLDNATVESGLGATRLTPAEFELLRYLMQHADQILPSERLLQEVWLYPPGVGDPAVVRWHVKNLRRKIEPDPEKPSYLRTISHHGYIFVSEPSLK